MVRKFSVVVVAAAMFTAPLAFGQGKAQCEAECDDTSKICEDAMLKKLGKDNKQAVGQVKKICADAAKQCKADCGK
jgi:hypothetical protein